MSKLPYPYPTVKKFWGLVEYRPRWTLTLRAWIVLFLAIASFGTVVATQVQPFLAISMPVKAEALLLEGWVNDDVIQGAAEAFKQDGYQLIFTTGSPLARGRYLSEYKSYAELTAATLIALGVDREKVIPIPTPQVATNRTAATAEAVRDWLSRSQIKIKGLNVYSYDTHTRRSWLAFQQVLEPEIKVGAIAYPSPSYNPQRWWSSSEGFRSVFSEAIAYSFMKLMGTD